MSYSLVGEKTGRTTHRQVYWVTPASMPGPFKCWSIKIVDSVLRGPKAGAVREKHKTCHSLQEAQKHIQTRLRHVP
ncbi:MAG: hypothetical protein M0D55_08015 [Elusimicrobiota bacterium]|nr:MAG: hypothetical protein M0D55_08015 [Elusimicrobiota bacterium]